MKISLFIVSTVVLFFATILISIVFGIIGADKKSDNKYETIFAKATVLTSLGFAVCLTILLMQNGLLG